MNKSTNINIELSIFGEDFDLNELTKILGITPTKTWKKGDSISNNLVSKKKLETNWSYSIGSRNTLDLDVLTSELVNVFKTKIDLINKFIKKNNLSIKIFSVIKIVDGATPALFFNKEFIEFSHKLNLEVDIDTYILNN